VIFGTEFVELLLSRGEEAITKSSRDQQSANNQFKFEHQVGQALLSVQSRL